MKLGVEWGKCTWIFIHSLAEKVKENDFSIISAHIIKWVISICKILPCPYCASHANIMLKSYNFKKIINKNDLKQFLFEFHNKVNKRIRKKQYPISILNMYKNIDFRKATANWYNNFIVLQYDVKTIWEKKERNKVRNQILNSLKTQVDCFEI